MIDNSDKNNSEYITFRIDNSIFCDAVAYERFLKNHIKNGNKIPARVLKKYFSFFKLDDRNEIEDKIRKENIEIISSKILKALSKKDYYFQGKNTSQNSDKIIHDIPENNIPLGDKLGYSLDSMLKWVISFILNNSNNKKKWQKDDYIAHSYKKLIEYHCNILNKQHQRFISEYKLYVLSAHITVNTYGSKITNKGSPTNEDLYHSVRNAISKIKNPD